MNLQEVEQLAHQLSCSKVDTISIRGHAFGDLQSVLQTKEIRRSDFVLFDLSSLTRLHVIALASSLVLELDNTRWVASYCIPENYLADDSTTNAPFGWRDIIIAPLAETSSLLNESGSRGIVIPGQEGDRLVVALAEIEPSGGLFLLSTLADRPDVHRVTRSRNRKVMEQLMRTGFWSDEIVNTAAIKEIARLTLREIVSARSTNSPVILFPFGSKVTVFGTSYELARQYPTASWFVYPIPWGQDSTYSEGILRNIWIGRDKLQL